MLSFIRKLFSQTSVPAIDDPDFGRIQFEPSEYDGSVGFWQMDNDWTLPDAFADVGCSSIPGDTSGPFPEARKFLLGKRDSLLDVWDQASPALEELRTRWRSDTANRSLKEVFILSSLAMDEPITDPPYWDVSFEPREGFWICATIRFRGDTVIGSSCDT